MRVRSMIVVGLSLLALPACTDRTRDTLTLGVAGPSRASTLAFQADETFGRALSRRDWRRLARAELKALDFVAGGQSAAWGQSNGRARGTVEVSQPFSIASRECRRFRHAMTVAGKSDSVTGVACRSGKGPWTLVS